MGPISMVPASEEEASNSAGGEYNLILLNLPKAALSEEERLNIALKEPIKMTLEEKQFRRRAISYPFSR